jgi:NAD-dependent deacetylase
MARQLPVPRVVILTGAGISAESGIPTFRDANGLWNQHRVEDVASPEGWVADASLVWKFYSQRRREAAPCLPNAAHMAVAELEARLGERFLLVTQNVDDLHEKAGSKRVIHMHGELYKSRCEDPECASAPFADSKLYESTLPLCRCGAKQRPHIVWFGEMPFEMHAIKRAVQASDVFITIGSSGSVYPAAGLVGEILYRKQQGERARSIYIGLQKPDNAASFDEVVLGPASATVSEVLATLA